VNVDDAGRRAGADLRQRFDGLGTPSIEMQPAHSSHRRRGALVATAVAVAVVVALVMALAGPWRDPGPASSQGGTWRRQPTSKAFGPHTQVHLVASGGPGLVALGEVNRDNEGADLIPAVWTSPDGEHWTRLRNVAFPSGDFYGFANLEVDHGTLVVAARGGDDDQVDIWRSTDLWTWRRVARLAARDTQIFLTDVPRGFAATARALAPATTSIAWTSVDGRRWKEIHRSPQPHERLGLLAQARLGRVQVALDPRNNFNQPPGVYTSRDGLHWVEVPGANPPPRFSSLVANAHHTRLFGIEYERSEIRGDFGGRIWSTRDAKTWTEITSFHQAMPVANPDHIVQIGKWWAVGGNTGLSDGNRRDSMWSSPDLRHWYEMPPRLRGSKADAGGVSLIAHDGKVVGLAGRVIYLWTPPD
jgi:hypothetical protein